MGQQRSKKAALETPNRRRSWVAAFRRAHLWKFVALTLPALGAVLWQLFMVRYPILESKLAVALDHRPAELDLLEQRTTSSGIASRFRTEVPIKNHGFRWGHIRSIELSPRALVDGDSNFRLIRLDRSEIGFQEVRRVSAEYVVTVDRRVIDPSAMNHVVFEVRFLDEHDREVYMACQFFGVSGRDYRPPTDDEAFPTELRPERACTDMRNQSFTLRLGRWVQVDSLGRVVR